MRKKAFTLAEVLTVIAILGVVAILTVTNTTGKVDSDKNIAMMKTAMSQIDAAIAKIVEENASISNVCTTSACVGEQIKNNMDTGTVCGTSNISNCFSTNDLRGNATCAYAFVLTNGVSVCTKNNDMNTLFIDVDGPLKGDDKYGSDKFEFKISDDGLDFINSGNQKTHGSFSSGDETLWAFKIGNQDYLKCSGSLKWGEKESCQ